jgi:hypothetical protein
MDVLAPVEVEVKQDPEAHGAPHSIIGHPANKVGELVRPEPGPYWYRAVFSLTFQALVFGNPMWVMRSTETRVFFII